MIETLPCTQKEYNSKQHKALFFQFLCCGRQNGSDYGNPSMLWNSVRAVTFPGGDIVNMSVPPSCCPVKDGGETLVSNLKKGSATSFNLLNEECPFQATDANTMVSIPVQTSSFCDVCLLLVQSTELNTVSTLIRLYRKDPSGGSAFSLLPKLQLWPQSPDWTLQPPDDHRHRLNSHNPS